MSELKPKDTINGNPCIDFGDFLEFLWQDCSPEREKELQEHFNECRRCRLELTRTKKLLAGPTYANNDLPAVAELLLNGALEDAQQGRIDRARKKLDAFETNYGPNDMPQAQLSAAALNRIAQVLRALGDTTNHDQQDLDRTRLITSAEALERDAHVQENAGALWSYANDPTTDEAAAFELHLETCESCHRELEHMQSVVAKEVDRIFEENHLSDKVAASRDLDVLTKRTILISLGLWKL